MFRQSLPLQFEVDKGRTLRHCTEARPVLVGSRTSRNSTRLRATYALMVRAPFHARPSGPNPGPYKLCCTAVFRTRSLELDPDPS